MAATTKIAWADATINFWTGCEKVSEGCKFCYMYRTQERWGREPSDIVLTRFSYKKALAAELEKLTGPSRIFVNSWSDFWFDHPEAHFARGLAFEYFKEYPQHVWMLLTKRPENILKFLPKGEWFPDSYPNVWVGVSAENQEQLNNRVPFLNSSWFSAPVRTFVSVEPMLGPITLKGLGASLKAVDWVIIGGESGNETGKYRYRPMQLEWAENLIRECVELRIPVFFKQTGTWLSKVLDLKGDRHGSNPDNFPPALQFQKFPESRIVIPEMP